MASRLHAPWALLPDGWSRDVVIDIGDDGIVASVTPGGQRDGAEGVGGPLVPAMPNLHSHAFQRGVAGRTGHAGASGEDSFWTWRQAMYAFLERLDPEGFEAIAAQVFVEMAKAGYGGVAEFHYVHHDEQGRRYADPAELAKRVLAAARRVGMPITLLPVFYAHGGFNGAPPSPAQRRFTMPTDEFARLVESIAPAARAGGAVLGIAPHSLRAVTPDQLERVVAAAPAHAPIHIHIAEQSREIEEFVAWSGRRPVEWLLAQGIDARWCLVHATHMVERETRALASSGAVVGIAATTEADLGDGIFPGVAYTAAGGRWGVGSDSNAIVDPFAELRQLEYSQRLFWRRRNLMHHGSDGSVGTAMWLAAARGGAQACGRHNGAIEAGAAADLVVLDSEDPGLAGHDADTLLDAAIFGPARAPVRHTMLGGRWVVRDGRHADEEAVLEAFVRTVARVAHRT